MPRYYIATLGCKLNQFDSAHAEGILRGESYSATDDPAQADVILLNTCTVTMKADADGRRLARRLRRLNPEARIVATGCYAEREPEALRSLGVLDEVVGLKERPRLPTALLGEERCQTASIDLFFGDRSRAFLRVQEGCDLACSYCIIPSVRGPSRSVDAATVTRELCRLAERGVREVGLTGVNTGDWGKDLEPAAELADLLEEIVGVIEKERLALRIRLGSLEPRTVSERVLALLAAHRAILVPHIQIPLQSGSDRILGRMSRNYRTRHYREIVERAALRVPDICLGADVITGFPLEDDEAHAETEAFIRSLPLAYLHVFSYSPRPGTRAAELPQEAPERVIGERTRSLRAIGEELGRRFRSALVGRELTALGLHATAEDGRTRMLTDNYVEVLVPDAPQGELRPIRLSALAESGLVVSGELA